MRYLPRDAYFGMEGREQLLVRGGGHGRNFASRHLHRTAGHRANDSLLSRREDALRAQSRLPGNRYSSGSLSSSSLASLCTSVVLLND